MGRTRHLPLFVLLVVVAACAKPVPADVLEDMDRATRDCDKCAGLVDDQEKRCIERARAEWQSARGRLSEPLEKFDARGVAHVRASEIALGACARPK
jgi:hypothetical protein